MQLKLMTLEVIRTRRDIESDFNLEFSSETTPALENQLALSAESPNSMAGITPTLPPDVVQWHQLFLQMPIAKVIAGIFAALAIANTAHHVRNSLSGYSRQSEKHVLFPCLPIALPASTRLHVPERAALDHPYSVHCASLRTRHVPRACVFRNELLRHLCLFRRYSFLV